MSKTLRTLAAVFVGTLVVMAGAVGSASAAGLPGATAVQRGLQDLSGKDAGLQKVHNRRYYKHRYHRRHHKYRRLWRNYSYYPYYYGYKKYGRRHHKHHRHSYRRRYYH
ncbi:MAG: hypothetical protein KJ587_05010 [Alphaproteobacteria bacterium]|nr:hypothetical protein [Alphaproteobacteria bacterium]